MSDFPETLKTWRKARRFSQLELAMEADVSSRHISFLETGRARPSPEMIARLGDALELSLSTRNQMLTRAGFAPRYQQRNWSAKEMAPVRAALEHMLIAHAPYPAMAIDRLWKLVRLNRSAEMLFGQFGASEGDSLLDIIRSGVLENFVENWAEVAHHTAYRLRTESAAQGGIKELDMAAHRLSQVKGFNNHSPGPVIPTIYRAGNLRLSLFATIAQFGTPDDLTLDDLKVELFFPADEATEALLKSLASE